MVLPGALEMVQSHFSEAIDAASEGAEVLWAVQMEGDQEQGEEGEEGSEEEGVVG
jgi:hypothetical protein